MQESVCILQVLAQSAVFSAETIREQAYDSGYQFSVEWMDLSCWGRNTKSKANQTIRIEPSLTIYAQQILVNSFLQNIFGDYIHFCAFILCVWMFCGMFICALHVGYSGTRIRNYCQPQCGCWELNMGLLELQPVFVTTDPFLLPALTPL